MFERGRLVLVAGAVILLGVLLLRGCSGYGEVSQSAYKLAKALHSICDRQDEAGLKKFLDILRKMSESEEISSQEQRWLSEISQIAQEGDWEQATKMARQLMEDQVAGK